ncbi:MAG: hypothetical protein HKN59_03235, partial [Gammaproteobacteria bacterium]|nr:hypothetical protein [Gammaproteobacteria bacterium]
EQHGEILRTEMQMKMLAFSHFAQFVHRWDERVQIHDDTLDGRFHSNSTINLAWDRNVQPKFLGKVTTAARSVRYGDTRGHRRREDIFAGGIETGVRSIPLARRYQAHEADDSIDGRQVFEFAGDTHVRFHEDGSFSWRDANDTGGHVGHEALGAGTTYLIGKKNTTFFVSGRLSGNVTIYTPERIIITGNVTYAQEGAVAETGGSFLGLVAAKSVEIAEPEVTGPGPLYVHGAIYAGRIFKVRDYRRRELSQLYIYGSVTAGSVSATEPRYSTRIEFDKRLEERRPAGFPVTDRFELTSWDGEWTRVSDSVGQ